jgi:hypothetical protein
MAGLMNPHRQQSDLMKQVRRAFGPLTGRERTIEERLQALPENELELVLQMARMVKTAQSFIINKTESYRMLVDRMYPKMDARLRMLIADVLQDADPLEEPQPQQDTRSEAIQATQSAYSAVAAPESLQKEPEQLELMLNPEDAFMRKMEQSESSGRSDAEITIKDGRTFTGLYQFGDARLSDYRKATGAKFTTQEFKEDEALQRKVASWHFKDIDAAIDKLGNEASGFDRDGLKAVAHLGGIGGMRKFVRTKGKYDPSDELGTSLSKYYQKFSA